MVKWEEPPDRRNPANRVPAPAWTAELRKHPKRWAMVEDDLTISRANYLQQMVSASYWPELDGEKWEATRRTNPETGMCELYARYLGRRHNAT